MKQALPNINLEDFNYHLPDEKIAKFPLESRDSSKLLIYKKGQIINSTFKSIFEYLPSNSHLVFNNTKVVNARVLFKNNNGAQIEIMLLQPSNSDYIQSFDATKLCKWQCIIGNKKKWKSDEPLQIKVIINDTEFYLFAKLTDPLLNIVEFTWNPLKSIIKFSEILNTAGQVPLPPYLNRNPTKADDQSYQTIYSKELGAVAAPTAGLHFTKNIFSLFQNNSITSQFITLHVGAGTFLPIKEKNILNHKMHSEQIIFTKQNITDILNNLENIIAVGTTSLRALESLYWFGIKIINKSIIKKSNTFFIEKLFPYNQPSDITSLSSIQTIIAFMDENNFDKIIGETEIFIFNTYNFKICKGLVTNFHQPKSTLLLLISALVGNAWKKIYEIALENNYRFLSYGDSSLLIP